MKTLTYNQLNDKEQFEIKSEIQEWTSFLYYKLYSRVNENDYENPIKSEKRNYNDTNDSFEIYDIKKDDDKIIYYIKTYHISWSSKFNYKADVYYTVEYDKIANYDNYNQNRLKIDEDKTTINFK